MKAIFNKVKDKNLLVLNFLAVIGAFLSVAVYIYSAYLVWILHKDEFTGVNNILLGNIVFSSIAVSLVTLCKRKLDGNVGAFSIKAKLVYFSLYPLLTLVYMNLYFTISYLFWGPS